MPRNITVTFDDGTTHVYQQAPDNITPEQVQQRAQADFGKSVKALDGGRPAAVEAGAAINQIPRQLGLTARYAVEGIPQALEIVTEPIRQNITDPLGRLFGWKGQSQPLSQAASAAADRMGLPKPDGANERVVGDMTRMGFGSMAVGGGVRQLANQLPKAGQLVSGLDSARRSTGTGNAIATALSANPGQQVVSAVGAGGAAGASREAGGSPGMQAVAGLLGGIAAPTAMNLARSGYTSAKNAATKLVAPELVDKQVDSTIRLTLQRSGIDWNDIDAATRAAVRNDVRNSLKIGQDLNGEALKRLIDFRRTGLTPTAGAVSLDPVQITREKNLSKIGVNTSDASLQRLAQVENQNNAALIRNLNEGGAANAADPYATGEQLVGALTGYADRQKQGIGRLYDAARDSSGRSANLDGYAFTSRANQLLDEKMLGYAVPESVSRRLNQIASGEVPFTVEFAEQMKTVLGDIARSDRGGATAKAMSVIRQALDDTPIRAQNVNPGNLPAILGAVPPSMAGAGQDAVDAFNRARSANRQFMGQVERTPALAAALDGAAPDNFLNKYVIGKSANVRDVDALTSILRGDRINPQNLPATAEQIAKLPAGDGRQALEATKNAIVDHLKRQALGGAADEVGNFSQSAYNKALRDIGERKLSLFFSPEEIDKLKAVGRVASYTQFQPRGSAVNNSNSGALAAGSFLDFLGTASARLPLGLKDTVSGTISGMQARQAMTPGRGLLVQPPPVTFADRVGAPLIYGGLLAAPQVIPNR